MKKVLAIIMCALIVGSAAVLSGCGSDRGQMGSLAGGDEYRSSDDVQTKDTPEQTVSSGKVQSTISTVGKDNEKVSERLSDFSRRLFIDIYSNESNKGENVVVSPLSIYSALSMCLNGAEGNTKTEMKEVLSGYYNYGEDGKMYEQYDVLEMEQINSYFYDYMQGLETEGESKTRLSVANSIWLNSDRSDIVFGDEFLSTGENCYGAEIRREHFKPSAAKKVNSWVSKNTDGMIDSIVNEDDMKSSLVTILLNAVAFDGEWAEPYDESDVNQDTFTCSDGSQNTVDFMYSTESRYIDDGSAVGFIKDYKFDEYPKYAESEFGENGTVSRFSFIALLPNEDIEIDEYLSRFSSKSLSDAVQNAQDAAVNARLPKFDFDYQTTIVPYLQGLGMHDAFDPVEADFSSLGKNSDSGDSGFCIGDIRHKAKITVDEQGTKAAAVTAILMTDDALEPIDTDCYEVNLNRPFVFAIYDNYENIPIFIGTVRTIE